MFTFIQNYRKMFVSLLKNEFGAEMSSPPEKTQKEEELDGNSKFKKVGDIFRSLMDAGADEDQRKKILEDINYIQDETKEDLKGFKYELDEKTEGLIKENTTRGLDLSSNNEGSETLEGLSEEDKVTLQALIIGVNQKWNPKNHITKQAQEILKKGESKISKEELNKLLELVEKYDDKNTLSKAEKKPNSEEEQVIDNGQKEREDAGLETVSEGETPTEKTKRISEIMVNKDPELSIDDGKVYLKHVCPNGKTRVSYFTMETNPDINSVDSFNAWKEKRINQFDKEEALNNTADSKNVWTDPDTGKKVVIDSTEENNELSTWEKTKEKAREIYNYLEDVTVSTEDGLSDIIGVDLVDDDVKTDIICGLENDKTMTVEYDRISGDVSIDTEWADNVIDFKVDNVKNITDITPEKIKSYIAEYNKRAADGTLFDKAVKGAKDVYNSSVEWTKEKYEQVLKWLEEILGEPDMGEFVGVNGEKVVIEYDKETGQVSADTSFFDGIMDFDMAKVEDELKGEPTKEKVQEIFAKEKANYEKIYNEKVVSNAINRVNKPTFKVGENTNTPESKSVVVSTLKVEGIDKPLDIRLNRSYLGNDYNGISVIVDTTWSDNVSDNETRIVIDDRKNGDGEKNITSEQLEKAVKEAKDKYLAAYQKAQVEK